MKAKDPFELEVASTLAAVRTMIRLKHTTAANVEINELLPQVEAAMQRAAISGKPYKVNLASLLDSK